MLLSFLFALAGGLGGLAAAWHVSVPASAAIVMILTALYLLAALANAIRSRTQGHM